MGGLSGTGLIGDDLFLMAHDDLTGRPFLHPKALGLGLAAGLLAELALPGQLRLSRGLATAADGSAPPDPLDARVLALLLAERQLHPVGDWLAFLARTAASDVAARLAGAGYLEPASRRLRRGGQWVPADPDCAFASLARARPALEPARPPVYSAVLAGLAVGCGLGSRLLPYGPPEARYHLRQAITCLPAGLSELIAQTQAAVDKAVLAHRM